MIKLIQFLFALVILAIFVKVVKNDLRKDDAKKHARRNNEKIN